MSGVNNVIINTLRVNNTQLLTLSGEKEIPNEIHDVHVNDNNVYLYYDINITEDDFKEKEQLDIDLSKIKKNILKHKVSEHNEIGVMVYTIDYMYNNNKTINVLLTYYIQKEQKSKIQLFTILYQFTNLDYSIVTNETIKFYKDKKETDYKLTSLTVLNVKLNYIQNNNNSGDNRDEQQENDKITYNAIEVEVDKPKDITPVEEETNNLIIVRFVEPETQIIPIKDETNDDKKNEFVREQQTSSFYREKIYGYEEPEPFKTYKDKFDLYNLNIKFSDCYATYPHSYPETVSVQMRSSDNVELKDSLYYHIYKFIERMNDKTVFEELHQIKGPLNKDKKKK